VRRAAVEAEQRVPAWHPPGPAPRSGRGHRGRNIGIAAAARELTVLVFYGLRDHRIPAASPPHVDQLAAWYYIRRSSYPLISPLVDHVWLTTSPTITWWAGRRIFVC